MHALTRRDALRGLALFCAGCAGQRVTDSGRTDTGASGSCTAESAGASAGYCLVASVVVRVRGAAAIAVGEQVLGNVDDNTAVLVGRDADGFFARSAICTHQCCIVALCDDEACNSPNPTPDPCGTVGPASADRVLCPCHGSVFRVSDGEALTGPATVPLPCYVVTVDGADLLVDTGTEVDPATRTPA